MSESGSESIDSRILFTNLVVMLSTSALQYLGKLINPLTNKAEVNIEAAQVPIDMLNMLKDKTEGNLDAEEKQMLNDVLSTLQMNYVEVSRNAPANKEQNSSADAEDEDQQTTSEPSKDKDAGKPEVKAGDDAKEPKYHKSYGG